MGIAHIRITTSWACRSQARGGTKATITSQHTRAQRLDTHLQQVLPHALQLLDVQRAHVDASTALGHRAVEACR